MIIKKINKKNQREIGHRRRHRTVKGRERLVKARWSTKQGVAIMVSYGHSALLSGRENDPGHMQKHKAKWHKVRGKIMEP